MAHFIHEPHPSKVLKAYQVRDAVMFLTEQGGFVMSQTLEHRGYDGSVLFSAEDRLLHGRVLGIRDVVSFEGTDIEGLESNFKAAVEEYLAFCEAEGKAPDNPFRGSFNVRIGQALHERAARFAEEHDRRLDAVIVDALQEYLSRSA